MRNALRSFAAAVTFAAAVGPAAAQTAPALPPGMTPALMQRMMTLPTHDPRGLPKGARPYSGCIPTMGVHYARPADWPLGPIYGYYRERPVFIEYMPTVAQFKAGFNLDDIKPQRGYTIDHVDIWYEKTGHPGLPVPHYDIHAWYVPHRVHMTYCDNPSGKRPPWL